MNLFSIIIRESVFHGTGDCIKICYPIEITNWQSIETSATRAYKKIASQGQALRSYLEDVTSTLLLPPPLPAFSLLLLLLSY